MRGLFANLAVARTVDLAIAPAWIALAAAFVLLRRQNVSRET
ncbi:hypothetical protein [Winogradskya humida]|nr:hypothetical protein [Actinoplanes humidus]